MTIDLHIPTSWQELTTEQLREVVDTATKGMRKEEVLLVLLCKFSGIKMVAGTADEDDKRVVHTYFKDAEGHLFDLEDWQVQDFCRRLDYIWDEKMPIDVAWPFQWDRYLMDTNFGDWFRADVMMLRFADTGEAECLVKATEYLGDPHPDLQDKSADFVLLLKWYDCFKDWLQESYPLVFPKKGGSDGTAASPVESRRDIMLMLNDGKPQDNEKIEQSNLHDVLSALQHKIEMAKHLEEKMSNLK